MTKHSIVPSSLREPKPKAGSDEEIVQQVQAMSPENLRKLTHGPNGEHYSDLINAAFERLAEKNPKPGPWVHSVRFGLNSANEPKESDD